MPSRLPVPGTDLRRQGWLEHRRLRRAEFVTGALAAVRQHGAETGLEEMAEAIGVSKSVVYRHFADRDDLFETVLASIADDVLAPRILAELAALSGGSSGRAALDQAALDQAALDQAGIRRIVRAFIAVVEEEPKLYDFALAQASSASGASFERRIAQALAAVLGERLRAVGQDTAAAEVWAFGVVGMLQLATQRWFDQRAVTADALADYLAALVAGGLTGVLAAPDVDHVKWA